MKISFFCCLTEKRDMNMATINSLKNMAIYNENKGRKVTVAASKVDKKFQEKKEAATVPIEIQILLNVSRDAERASTYTKAFAEINSDAVTYVIDATPYKTVYESYKKMSQAADGAYIIVMNAGDCISPNAASVFTEGYVRCCGMDTYMVKKIFHDESVHVFQQYKLQADDTDTKFLYVIDLNRKYDCFPFGLTGVIIKKQAFDEMTFDEKLGLETERDAMLRLMAKRMKTCFLPSVTYTAYEYEEGNVALYRGLYIKEWYFDSITRFWMPFLTEMKETYGKIPEFIQYNFMHSVKARVEGNLDNKNKHVIEEGKGAEYLKLLGQALRLIDDDIMMNRDKLEDCSAGDTLKWVYGLLCYGTDYKFERYFLSGRMYYGVGNTLLDTIPNLSTRIQFMNYKDGKLEIDGSVHPILFSLADRVWFCYDNRRYEITYNERYSLTKIFGMAVSKWHAFHLSIPIKAKSVAKLSCEASVWGRQETIRFLYSSHFSRLCDEFGSSHWIFGDHREYMMLCDNGTIVIHKVTKYQKFIRELKLLKDMLQRDDYTRKYAFFRMLYFVCRPFMTRRPIWMYIDKIYKGGDSSEYLYKYAQAKNKKIKHYYLIDKNSTDYNRLKKEGYRPLVRNSIKHRLLFLYADMMIISNSTVYAFNGYGLANSAFIRDLTHFHVCCVQHGMSVQKIAIAQNRLRDNIRLYFCASKYEIENLSRPVYDYVGYDALKLTGVPRYDGLVDRAKKQIMISPTWRMQAAVPVRTNEGDQRDYNPLFKETSYFKVFNALINDKRLIDAAKEYGYRIKYVLHPIVSAQVNDFDKNDFVDVIPAVGDMSYEDMFCESSLMVTDFSGIQFDFAYMRKPLVYLHHKDIPQHYEEGSFYYDTMAFGEICHDNDELIDVLIDYMKNDCKMKPEYVKRADDFFYYSDHNNCERIYNEMIAYQEKYVLPERI